MKYKYIACVSGILFAGILAISGTKIASYATEQNMTASTQIITTNGSDTKELQNALEKFITAATDLKSLKNLQEQTDHPSKQLAQEIINAEHTYADTKNVVKTNLQYYTAEELNQIKQSAELNEMLNRYKHASYFP